MHAINGTWKILAKSNFGPMPSVDELYVNEDGKTFQGVMHDEKSGKDFPIVNGIIIDEHTVTFEAAMTIGLIKMNFLMESHLSEDGMSCQGTAKAGIIKGTFEGTKIKE